MLDVRGLPDDQIEFVQQLIEFKGRNFTGGGL